MEQGGLGAVLRSLRGALRAGAAVFPENWQTICYLEFSVLPKLTQLGPRIKDALSFLRGADEESRT